MGESLILCQPRAFLGVCRSVTGRAWRGRLDAAGEALALAIAQTHGTGDLLARVLAGRGVPLDSIATYLAPSLRNHLPDPLCVRDMGDAARRIAAAIKRCEKIAIFGDYDVDGAASAALLFDYFAALGVPSTIHIPDRLSEGYGPNIPAIERLAGDGAKLLITVDCGTASHAPLAKAAKLGLDPIVLDHHQAPEHLPETIIVNPNRQDDLSGLGHLCAAGVVFLTLVAVQRLLREEGFFSKTRPEPDLLAGLDLVALATVADVAPLVGLNRAFVQKGLALMHARQRPGLKSLFDLSGLAGPPSVYHLGFMIGPRINAGGRIGDAALGARLLTATDPIEARVIAEKLHELNRDRQELERATLEEAEASLLSTPDFNDRPVAIAVGEGWHPGVAGLIASRLAEKFGRPAFAITFGKENIATGSGRSIAKVDLGRAVRAAVEAGLLLKGGGHAMAAGITIARERLDEFVNFLNSELASAVGAARWNDGLLIDAALTAAAANADMVTNLLRGGPYGAGNPEPVFALPAHRLLEVANVGNGHVRLRAEADSGRLISGIAFRAAAEPLGQALHAARGQMVHLAGTLTEDRYGGKDRVQLRICDLALP
ncbi:MAG TPA: single-stranded-DNA-specific exonuclease RecJ [Methylocella sp.]|nr:single-stranded-DNA-specific exonuclease RecJ [Methylocella sp.]